MLPLVLAAISVVGTEGLPEGGDQDPWTQSVALEKEGKHDAAAEVFAPLVDTYPQDYATQLRAAWLFYLAGDYRRAEARYERAIELSGGTPLARSGLAWTHLQRGKRRQARREFEAVLETHPEHPSAHEGLAELRRRRFVARPSVHAIGHAYSGHPDLNWALGGAVSMPMVIAEHAIVAPTYRVAHFLPQSQLVSRAHMAGPGGNGNGNNGGSGTAQTFQQHEAHLAAGITWPIAGLLLQYGFLSDGSFARDDAHVVGLSARYSPWGDGIVDASLAHFDSVVVGRIAPAWRMPATKWLDIRPGFAIQVLDEVLGSGFATLVVHGKPGSLALGGKGGPERRPVYLEVPAIFGFDGKLWWGAWLAGDLRLPKGVHLHASYETHHLRPQPDQPTQIHYLALGLSWRSAEASAP
jgi:hypothetical protein